MTNRQFMTACLSNPKEDRNHASLEYKNRTFYSYDDEIGRIHGDKIVIDTNPATITTSGHIDMLTEVAKRLGYKMLTYPKKK